MALKRLFYSRRSAPPARQPKNAVDLSRVSMIHNGQILTAREYADAIGDEIGQRMYRGLGSVDFQYDDTTLALAYGAALTAWICTNIRAGMVRQIPLEVKDDAGYVMDMSPAAHFLEHQKKMMFGIEHSLLIWGKAYLLKRKNRFNFPSQLELLNPLDVWANIDPVHDVVTSYRVMQLPQEIPPEDMVAIYWYNPLSDVDGVSAYEVAMRQLDVERNLSQYAASFFINSARPDGILNFEGSITKDERKEHRETWKKVFQGARNSFRTFVGGTQAGGKWTWTPIQSPPADLAMGELDDRTQTKVCGVFRMNPVLVGFGKPTDPLSAQNTYEQIRIATMRDEIVPEVEFICEELESQWLHVDFQDLDGRMNLVPNRSKVDSAALSTPDRATTAQGNVTNGVWTVNEGREHVGTSPTEIPVIQMNPAWAVSAFQGQVIRRNEARRAIGMEPDLQDGYVFELNPAPAPAPNPFGGLIGGNPFNAPNPIGQLPPPEVKSRIILLPAPKRSGPSCYIALGLAEHPAVSAVQTLARSQVPADSRQWWTDARDFHLTLAHCGMVDDNQAEAIRQALPTELDPLTLTLGKVTTFESEGEQPLVVLVEPDEDLLALQEKMAAILNKAGVEPSGYSQPDQFVPHVTLGYLGADVPAPALEARSQCTTDHLFLSRDDFKILHSTQPGNMVDSQLTSRAANVDLQLNELRTWREKVRRKGHDAPFKTQYVPDNVAEYVRTELGEGWNYSLVFEAAKGWLAGGPAPSPFRSDPDSI